MGASERSEMKRKKRDRAWFLTGYVTGAGVAFVLAVTVALAQIPWWIPFWSVLMTVVFFVIAGWCIDR